MQVDLSSISPSHWGYFDELLKLADQDGDGKVGVKDAMFFRKSGLPLPTLGEVWQLADANRAGKLGRDEFVVALLLISQAQQGRPVALDSLRTPGAIQPPKLDGVAPFASQQQPSSSAGFNWTVSANDRKRYTDLFRATDDNNDGFITGSQARNLLTKSGLPYTTLSHIWALSDADKDQQLDLQEFIIASVLIEAKLKGIDLPPVLPDQLVQSARSDSATPLSTTPAAGSPPDPHGGMLMNNLMGGATGMGMAPAPAPLGSSVPTPVPMPVPAQQPSPSVPTSASSEWMLQPAERAKFNDLFSKTDLENTGYITGEQARHLFGRSGLPNQELGRIWMLSDLGQDQRLDKVEFCIAMFLINSKLKGKDTPAQVPESLIQSARGEPEITSPNVATPTLKSKYDIDLSEFSSNDLLSGGGYAQQPPQQPQPQQGQVQPPMGQIPPHMQAQPHPGNLGMPTPAPNNNMMMGGMGMPNMVAQAMPGVGVDPLVGYPPAGLSSPSLPPNALGPNASGRFTPGSASPLAQPLSAGPMGIPPVGYGMGSVSPSPLELERSRQMLAQQDRLKMDSNRFIQEEAAVNADLANQLTEEQARLEAARTEVRALETELVSQKARSAATKEQISAYRLEIRQLKTQAEQYHVLLNEKRDQYQEENDLLTMLTTEIQERTAELEAQKRELDNLRANVEAVRASRTDAKHTLAGIKTQQTETKGELQRAQEESAQFRRSSIPAASMTMSPSAFAPIAATTPTMATANGFSSPAGPEAASPPSQHKPPPPRPASPLTAGFADLRVRSNSNTNTNTNTGTPPIPPPKPSHSPAPIHANIPTSTPNLVLAVPSASSPAPQHSDPFSASSNSSSSSGASSKFGFDGGFSFDNGREDPFSFGSKDSFGLGDELRDSFGSPASTAVPPSQPAAPAASTTGKQEANAFGGGHDSFGSDPSANSFFGNDTFGTSDSFGAAPSPSSAGSGSFFTAPTPANSAINPNQPPKSSLPSEGGFGFGGQPFGDGSNFFSTSATDDFGSTPFSTQDSFGASSPAPGVHSPSNAATGNASPSLGGGNAFGSDAFDSSPFGTDSSFGSSDTFGTSDGFGTSSSFDFGAPPKSHTSSTADSFGGF
eukprot:TRINITY_DN2255_c0_g1_i4.p1 TRINITY_DN2255_c0_g1~~TRINITY_DN2255_c0_g1_i4.p1  ORF type:complete len:1111 (+),score=298.94 TRINITY_DN2255_c0_g1_i4:251-3583(+)